MKTNFVFDAEGTLFSIEGLERLAKISLNGDLNAPRILGEIQQICTSGMNGNLPFNVSLIKRMNLFYACKRHVDELAQLFKKSLAPSIMEHKNFFVDHANEIFVISGGFKDFLMQALLELGIKKEHIFANEFIYNSEGWIIGLDDNNPLSMDGGKIEVVKNLNLEGHVIIIGDGTSEAKVRDAGGANEFWAYTEVCKNEVAIKMADKVVGDFGEIARSINTPVFY